MDEGRLEGLGLAPLGLQVVLDEVINFNQLPSFHHLVKYLKLLQSLLVIITKQ